MRRRCQVEENKARGRRNRQWRTRVRRAEPRTARLRTTLDRRRQTTKLEVAHTTISCTGELEKLQYLSFM